MSTLKEIVAEEIRAEMARQLKSVNELSILLGLGHKAAKRRYSGEQEFSLDEVAAVSKWLDVPVSQITSRSRHQEAVPA